MADRQFAPLYKIADQFISQANTLAESTDLATLAAGLRYAAARFAAFEASLRTDDLRHDKAEALDAYLNEFRAMLDENLDQYGEQQSKT
jgi:proline racemase